MTFEFLHIMRPGTKSSIGNLEVTATLSSGETQMKGKMKRRGLGSFGLAPVHKQCTISRKGTRTLLSTCRITGEHCMGWLA